MKSVRSSLEFEAFQSLSVYQELLLAASSGSSVVIANIENKIEELLNLSKSNIGNFTITGEYQIIHTYHCE